MGLIAIDSITTNSQNTVSIGLDVSHISPEVAYDFLGVTDKQLPFSNKWGHLDMDLYLTKMNLEHFFNNHFSIYGSLGVGIGVADYDLFYNSNITMYSSTNTSPAFSIGIGEKVYFGKNKGIYLKAGINYIRVLKVKTDLMYEENRYNAETNIFTFTHYSDIKLSDGMGTGEVELKIGYKF